MPRSMDKLERRTAEPESIAVIDGSPDLEVIRGQVDWTFLHIARYYRASRDLLETPCATDVVRMSMSKHDTTDFAPALGFPERELGLDLSVLAICGIDEGDPVLTGNQVDIGDVNTDERPSPYGHPVYVWCDFTCIQFVPKLLRTNVQTREYSIRKAKEMESTLVSWASARADVDPAAIQW